jgi:anti-anti-sigma regulatory factor
MSFEVLHNSDTEKTVRASGDLVDRNELRRLEETTRELVALGPQRVLLDLSECKTLDTLAVSGILSMYQRLKEIGCGLEICAGDEMIRDFFRGVALDTIIPLSDAGSGRKETDGRRDSG